MKGSYNGDKAVVKIFEVNSEEHAQLIIDTEVRL